MHLAKALVTIVFITLAGCNDDTTDPTPMAEDEPINPLSYHDGYWSAQMMVPGQSFMVTVINDTHVDIEAGYITVYAQNIVQGQVMAPPQLGPGECGESISGETVCYHPNAVYLNGTGQELDGSDGTGSWWVKHAWFVDGPEYYNCGLEAAQSYNCAFAGGDLMEDGITLYMSASSGLGFHNIRGPLLDQDPIAYELTRYSASSEPLFTLTFDCLDEPSALDGEIRPCPTKP